VALCFIRPNNLLPLLIIHHIMNQVMLYLQGMQLTDVLQRFYASHFPRYLFTADASTRQYILLYVYKTNTDIAYTSLYTIDLFYVTLETKSSFVCLIILGCCKPNNTEIHATSKEGFDKFDITCSGPLCKYRCFPEHFTNAFYLWRRFT
jgi:hypothetical protein